jgi:hypothetical protein
MHPVASATQGTCGGLGIPGSSVPALGVRELQAQHPAGHGGAGAPGGPGV